MKAAIDERASFDFIRYASVWEDADILCEALAPVAKGGRLLSICSAGDNALALLTLDPREVVVVDLNPAQLACLELRIAAFKTLNWHELQAFLGVLDSDHRVGTYAAVRNGLGAAARAYWDANPELIEAGVIHGGKFERYFHLFRRWVLPLIHSRGTIRELVAAKSVDEQHLFYQKRWDNWRWRALFRVFFSRFVMGRAGRDPEFFKHVQGSVNDRILERTRHALTEIPTDDNPFLHYIVLGNFAESGLPRYLRRAHYETIRDRLDRLTLLRGSTDHTEGPFEGFNLSDIFEYMDLVAAEACYAGLVEKAAEHARFAYWNMLAPRGCPAGQPHARPLTELSHELHRRDRAWFYSRFHVDEIRKDGA